MFGVWRVGSSFRELFFFAFSGRLFEGERFVLFGSSRFVFRRGVEIVVGIDIREVVSVRRGEGIDEV